MSGGPVAAYSKRFSTEPVSHVAGLPRSYAVPGRTGQYGRPSTGPSITFCTSYVFTSKSASFASSAYLAMSTRPLTTL